MSSAETMIEVPPELLPAGTEQRLLEQVNRFGDVESYEPRSNIELGLTPEQTASRLAEKEASEQLLRAATKSVQSAYAADDEKHEQMQ